MLSSAHELCKFLVSLRYMEFNLQILCYDQKKLLALEIVNKLSCIHVMFRLEIEQEP